MGLRERATAGLVSAGLLTLGLPVIATAAGVAVDVALAPAASAAQPVPAHNALVPDKPRCQHAESHLC